MPGSSDLFHLVKAMTKSEKRHFKLHCRLHRGRKNYERLFDAIDKQDRYDEQAIKQQFAGEPFTRQLHVTKYYLRNLILRSLRNYQSGSTRSIEARQHLRDAEILFGKELYRQASGALDKGEEIARKYELDAVLCDILDLKRSLAQHARPHEFDVLADIIAEQARAIDRLDNRNRYVNLIIDVSQSVIAGESAPVENEMWLESDTNAQTLEALVMHYNARYFRQVREGLSGEAEITLHTLIDRLEESPHRIAESPGLYVSSINNFVSYYVFNKQYDRAMELIQRGKDVYRHWTLKSENRSLLKQILRTYTIELEIIRNHSLTTTPAGRIDGIADFVDSNVNKMPVSYALLFWFQLGYIYFMRGDAKTALHWVNRFIQTRHKRVRTDLHIHARMLNLMIHLEDGASDAMDHGAMSHDAMDHDDMDHSAMDHSAMGHEGMNHGG
ncbi:MAG: hypothetical protein R3330_04785, partial [Saprospiraceae bacterium]|nr:hypothetical protein [Saprospiraceae bacterium]